MDPHYAKPLFLLLVLLCVTILCNAIFEDQVGIWDWHKQYVGKVTHAVFHTHGTGRKRVIVATEQNMLASVNLRQGEIFWRHVLGSSDTIQALDIVGKYAISLSGGGSTLRAWHLPDGQLVWETDLKVACISPVLLVTTLEVSHGKENIIIVLGGKMLHAVSSVDGAIQWTTDVSALSGGDSFIIQNILLSVDNSKLYMVGWFATSELCIWHISLLNGQVILQEVAKIGENIDPGKVVVTKDTVIAFDLDDKTVLTGHIGYLGDFPTHRTSIHTLIPDMPEKVQLLPTTLQGVFSVNSFDCIVLLRVGPYDGLKVLDKFDQPSILGHGLELVDNRHALAVLQHVTDRKVALRIVVFGDDKSETLDEFFDLDVERGLIQQFYLNAYVRRDSSFGFRALVVAEDDSLSLLQQREVVWSREDGLGSIVDASTAELPLEREGAMIAEVERSLLEWLKVHFIKLKATFMVASSEDMATIQALRGDKMKMTRDHNGFRKLLIVLTKAGKILALHTGDGRIVWSLLVPALRSITGKERTLLKLLPWQIPHKHAFDKNPVVLVAGKLGTNNDVYGVLSWVDVYTGKEIQSSKLAYDISQIIPLPKMDSLEQRLHLVVDTDTNVHLFPTTQESLEVFLDEVSNIYFYTVDKTSGVITGYGIKHPSAGEHTFSFESEKLWTLVFPSESERIVMTAARMQDEVVHTQAKVLPDQDVWYKYLSKNVLFVATVAPGGSELLGVLSPEETWLVAYVIDTVTGRILHCVKHANMQGPVHAVFSEHWVVYHYFNLRAHRYEMSVIEIYDKNRVNNKNVIELMLGKHNATAPVSSFSFPDLDVKSQSYFFSHSVKRMAVTSTARGITAKQLLLGTISDQVLALDKRFFDPRRSLNPTPQEREDGIIPLTESIPIYPQSYLTHAYQVEGLQGILTVPANLESTSLVFCYGQDLFFTHTAPSRTYDSLTEDFSYALLLMTIIALLIAIAVTWFLSERKELKEKWR